MSWAAVGGAAIGLVGNSLSKDKGGGAGTQTASKEPWAAAQPWLMDNILIGQAMQGDYMRNPMSARQQTALNNGYAQSDYMRGLVPSLLGQMQGQPLGYDKANPTSKARAWDWGATSGGLMGQQSVAGARDPAPAAAAAPVDDRKFVNHGDIRQNWNNTGGDDSSAVLDSQMFPAVMPGQQGSFGSFTYGMPMPKPGSKEYKDMSDYFAYGGADPYNRYGRGGGGGGLLAYAGGFGAGNGGGGSVGGSPSSDGSGGGSPGVW